MHADAYTDADGDAHADSYGDAHAYAESYAESDGHTYAYGISRILGERGWNERGEWVIL